jgi:hypothetical protein
VSLNGVKIYFQEQETKEQVAFIRDITKFCLGIIGRHDFNFYPGLYTTFLQISSKCSQDQIKSLILQYAKGFPTWKYLTTDASTLCPSNTPNEDATMVELDEIIREFGEEPLQLSFGDQSQQDEPESEEEQRSLVLFTQEQLEALLKMNRPDFSELVAPLKRGVSKDARLQPAKPGNFDGTRDRKVLDAWLAEMEDYLHAAKVGWHSAVELAQSYLNENWDLNHGANLGAGLNLRGLFYK